MNGFSDGGAMWRSPYEQLTSRHKKTEQSDTVALLQKLYQQINPFYKQVDNFLPSKANQLLPAFTDSIHFGSCDSICGNL